MGEAPQVIARLAILQMTNPEQIAVKLIEYNSWEFLQACQLRYKVFFAPHNLPYSTVFSPEQRDSYHAAIIFQDTVVAYGELVPQDNLIHQICQMVVHPDYQKQNLGRAILSTLIDIARIEGAIALTLNARLTAIAFYQKLGFQTCGVKFPSPTTGVMHIKMNQKL